MTAPVTPSAVPDEAVVLVDAFGRAAQDKWDGTDETWPKVWASRAAYLALLAYIAGLVNDLDKLRFVSLTATELLMERNILRAELEQTRKALRDLMAAKWCTPEYDAALQAGIAALAVTRQEEK